MQKKEATLISNKKKTVILITLFILLSVIFLAGIGIGRYSVPFSQVVKILLSNLLPIDETWTVQMQNVIMNVRLHRTIAAAIVGAALALSGATYQGIFKNPLVSPDILGVASGASVGAALAILLNLGNFWIQIFALSFGLAAVGMATLIPRLFRNSSSLMLVLAGVIVSGFMSAILGIFKYIADVESELPSIVYWMMGSLTSVDWNDIFTICPFMLMTGSVLILIRWRINILSLGEMEAKSLGINISLIRGIAIVCSTGLTACAICISGIIGWVGLIIPHFARLLIGEDNTYSMPATVLLGAIFMIVVDTAARNITGSEIPLSILTGLIGAPLFVLLLSHRHMSLQ